jgi:hypothetical protein
LRRCFCRVESSSPALQLRTGRRRQHDRDIVEPAATRSPEIEGPSECFVARPSEKRSERGFGLAVRFRGDVLLAVLAGRVSGGGGGPVAVELQEVVCGGDQPPL